jgi:hypothetical protein
MIFVSQCGDKLQIVSPFHPRGRLTLRLSSGRCCGHWRVCAGFARPSCAWLTLGHSRISRVACSGFASACAIGADGFVIVYHSVPASINTKRRATSWATREEHRPSRYVHTPICCCLLHTRLSLALADTCAHRLCFACAHDAETTFKTCEWREQAGGAVPPSTITPSLFRTPEQSSPPFSAPQRCDAYASHDAACQARSISRRSV